MKAIVIGPSLSGKTTLVRYLRDTTALPIKEIDEVLTELNHGTFPIAEQKINISRKAIKAVLTESNILFFSNTDYFTEADLSEARKHGFQIILLRAPLDVLLARNAKRVAEENYQNMSKWINGMIKYQEEISSKGLVDFAIQTDKSIAEVANELQTKLSP